MKRDRFIHLNQPAETVMGIPIEVWYVDAIGYDDTYLLNVVPTVVKHIDDVGMPLEEMYFDNESEAYAAMMDYYDENHVYFPYHDEWMEALKKDGIIESVEETVDSAVMEF